MKSTGNLPVGGDRLWNDLMALAAITDPSKPYTRRCFTPLFEEGRRWLASRFEEAGLSVRLDEGGNLIGRLAGSDEGVGTIMVGSHSDTVAGGGRFDGIAGVLTALEAVRSLREAGERMKHTIEVVDFLSEEPSEYGLSCVGSRAMARRLEPAMLAFREPGGETLEAAMRRMGARPELLPAPARDDIAAYLELHIEQGRALEAAGIDLGVITSIVGIVRLEIVFEGAADHAGTTPLGLRKDALLAAAATISAVRTEAERLNRDDAYFVGTVGVIRCEPNAANVIPRLAGLVIDARSGDGDRLSRFVEAINMASRDAAAMAGVERRTFSLLSDSEPAICDERIRRHVLAAASDLGFSAQSMASGAGHDAAFVGVLAPMAMIFVPSRDGKSHCAEEWTEQAELSAGAATLCEAIRRIDQDDFRPRPAVAGN
jgi:N-carbamoyl-L-amino-acid hydrolase